MLAIAIASVSMPNHYQYFSLFFVLVLIVQLVILSPPKDVTRIFFIILCSFLIEYGLLELTQLFDSFYPYVLLQMAVLIGCVKAIEYQINSIKSGKHKIGIKTLVSSWTVIKFLKRYALPVEVLVLAESFTNLNVIYDLYPYLKVAVAAGLFILLHELFKTKETEASLSC